VGKTGGENNQKKVVVAVKRVVEIKGSLYLCIPRKVVDHCRIQVGDEVGVFAGLQVMKVVLMGE